MRTQLSVIACISVTLLSGCASLDKDECLNADWHLIGLEDGAQGHLPSRIGEHREACAEYGVIPELASYRDGHMEGLEQFCTRVKGYHQGRRGKSYNGVCPSGLEEDFQFGYRIGKSVYKAEAETKKIRRHLKNLNQRLIAIDEDIADREARIISKNSTAKERKQLLEELDLLKEDAVLLQDEIEQTEIDLAEAEERYQRIQQRADRTF